MSSWSTAPEWARWLAMDANGSWWWHSKKPVIVGKEWSHIGCCEHTTFVERAPERKRAHFWPLSLEKRPVTQETRQ